MTIATQRNVLIGLTICLLAAASGAVVWSCSSLGGATESTSMTDSDGVTDPVPEKPSESAFSQAVASRKLRGPLYDPPPPTPKPTPTPRPIPKPVPTPPRLEFTLVGTIIDSAQSLAIIADATGNFDVKAEGESLELTPAGITVQSVESEQVTLDWQGRTTTVKLERSKGPRGGGNRNNRRKNRP